MLRKARAAACSRHGFPDVGAFGVEALSNAGNQTLVTIGVPTQSTPVQEASPRAMMAPGFTGLGFAGYRRERKERLAPAFS
jgi:hypothetical protein